LKSNKKFSRGFKVLWAFFTILYNFIIFTYLNSLGSPIDYLRPDVELSLWLALSYQFKILWFMPFIGLFIGFLVSFFLAGLTVVFLYRLRS